ncbi:MAG: glycosyl transferase, partial [Thauera sp.]|nr:glycosyl transferase [Thauera sp.]
GYAHGGVAEILGELFPQGAVAKGDVAAAARSTSYILGGHADAVRANHRFLLKEMQSATLSLYAQGTARLTERISNQASSIHA